MLPVFIVLLAIVQSVGCCDAFLRSALFDVGDDQMSVQDLPDLLRIDIDLLELSHCSCRHIDLQTFANNNDLLSVVSSCEEVSVYMNGLSNHVLQLCEGQFSKVDAFLDSTLCVREDYEIPKEGKLNGVYWCLRKRIVDPDFRAAVSSILANFHADFVYETDEMYTKTESRHLHAVSFCYEDCPVGVNPWDCYMGLLDGEWVFARRTSRQKDENGKWSFTYDVYRIPAEHHEILEVYWIA